MGVFSGFKRFFLGKPLDPLSPSSRKHIALVTLMAWIGLGADPLSSSCYGPEETFLALGAYPHLAIFIVIIMVVTIFIISLGYNQVIELFPSGGGGYKVASRLLHQYAGLVSGSALIVDYMLTIAVSTASGTDALFSFLPPWLAQYKLYVEAGAIIALMVLNLRGMKEAIYVLLPIFMGFVVTHFLLILYGIFAHSRGLMEIGPVVMQDTHQLAKEVGWLSVIGLVLHAYSLGAGTYTGLESVSNNVHRLAEPRVATGKRTMMYMAFSLSFTAGGITLLYLLWHAQPVPGQTLNAVVFGSILGDSWAGHLMLMLTLALEAGLLFVAANAGFASGPSVLASMAIDGWVPNRFRHLSSRLVVQNGVVLYGLAALAILYITKGKVSTLVILYSINVFITFTMSLLGISIYWARHRASKGWVWHLILSIVSCAVTASILCITLFFKFTAGGWMTVVITSSIVLICYLIRRHYLDVAGKLKDLDRLLHQPVPDGVFTPKIIDPTQSTAVIVVNSLSVGMHTLLSVLRLFPGQFKNFVFISVGEVDVESFSAEYELNAMQKEVEKRLDYFVRFCSDNGYPSEAYSGFATDIVSELKRLTDTVSAQYPAAIFFASQLIFSKDNVIMRFLHNQTPLILQHHLHMKGKELMIMPMKL